MTTTKVKRTPKAAKPEPLYVWLPITLLTRGDLIVTNKEEMCVQNIVRQGDEWHVFFANVAMPRQKGSEFYRSHNYLYTKASAEVKARLASKHDETKGDRL